MSTTNQSVETAEVITIPAPKFGVLSIEIEGTAPYMQARFSQKAKEAMMAKMAAGSTSKSKKKREARDFDDDFMQAQHIASDGWNGIPAAAIRAACIAACRVIGFKMTVAKQAVFVEADGYDRIDGVPLIKLNAPPPEKNEMAVRIQQTNDIRVRPMWREWGAVLNVKYDADLFTAEDIVNLVSRAGVQVGIGEGRPASKSSTGMGFGTFKVTGVLSNEIG